MRVELSVASRGLASGWCSPAELSISWSNNLCLATTSPTLDKIKLVNRSPRMKSQLA